MSIIEQQAAKNRLLRLDRMRRNAQRGNGGVDRGLLLSFLKLGHGSGRFKGGRSLPAHA